MHHLAGSVLLLSGLFLLAASALIGAFWAAPLSRSPEPVGSQ
ncbi:hypothetical protein [Glycomyces sp. YM15]|nr:hypothetical protein [Glycomyces sp. YM15]